MVKKGHDFMRSNAILTDASLEESAGRMADALTRRQREIAERRLEIPDGSEIKINTSELRGKIFILVGVDDKGFMRLRERGGRVFDSKYSILSPVIEIIKRKKLTADEELPIGDVGTARAQRELGDKLYYDKLLRNKFGCIFSKDVKTKIESHKKITFFHEGQIIDVKIIGANTDKGFVECKFLDEEGKEVSSLDLAKIHSSDSKRNICIVTSLELFLKSHKATIE